MTEARLDRIERKLDRLTDAVAKLETGFVELATEQRVRDQERANERADLLGLIPTVREIQSHIERLRTRVQSVESGTVEPLRPSPSLPPMTLPDDGPTQPGSTMLPAYPDERVSSAEVAELIREHTDHGEAEKLTGWDVLNRAVGIGENLARGFITYQRMWGFIVLGVFGPPGLAVGLAQAWMITHPAGTAPGQQPPPPMIVVEEAAPEPDPDPVPENER